MWQWTKWFDIGVNAFPFYIACSTLYVGNYDQTFTFHQTLLPVRKSNLLGVFEAAIYVALFIIGATFLYALNDLGGATNLSEDERSESSTGGPRMAIDEAFIRGKKVWNGNGCGSCHAKDMKTKLTGPALAGVTERWSAEPREHLYAWIRNSTGLEASGKSARATEMIDWSTTAMSRYPNLTDTEIEDLLAYIEGGA